MLSMLWLLLISQLSSLMAEQKEHQGAQPCGGRLKGPHGIIQTPNFPNAFPVPIKCKWIIEHDITNGTISIYFTQQYTTSGLTFTEYMYYDDDNMKFGERRAFTVTEENITRVKWLQVQSPVLVVELTLNALEGTQLRALGLLSVYGLNVTYAVRAPAQPRLSAPPAPTSDDTCSALECRLLGHCYATHDYQKFYCACFEGYTGPDCGVGPLCEISSNMCKNGGLCRQMGPAAVSCICAPGYTGDLCESRIADPECGIRECLEGCIDTTCDCNPRDGDSTLARFETKLQVVGKPNANISQEVIKQLTADLNTSDIALDEKIEILHIDDPDKEGKRLVSVRIWASRRLAGTLRGALARLADDRPPNSELNLVPTGLFAMQPALSLHALTINQQSEVWEGSEYILSCTAYGSPDIIFTWYKDGVKINFNRTTRDIWTRTVAEDALGRRISVLGVSEAQQVDSGRWSCAAGDAGRRRCRALHLAVLKPPDIRLLPSAITVNKGDNVSITCLAGASRVHGALGFSWSRERSLLPLVPGREVWEDLFPAGSVLKLYNVQKSGEFRCQVSSTAGTNYKSMMMWTLGENDEACVGGASHGLRWPRTAPGAYATASCSTGYTGETIRFCEPKTAQHGVKWRLPDFSGCISESLKTLYDQFIRISYGYSWKNITSVAKQYSHFLRSLPAHPGEGTTPLQHTMEMLHYLLSNAVNPKDKTDSVEHLLKIYDVLLKNPDSLLDEEKTFELQKALAQTASMKDYLDFETDEFLAVSKPVRNDKAHFKLEPKSFGNEEWLLMSAGIEFMEGTGNITAVVVQYKNLDSRLPSLRLSVENKNGREMEYEITSQQIQLFANGEVIETALLPTVTLSFAYIYNYSATVSKLACGLRSSSEPEVWNTQLCEVQITEPKHVSCRCQGLGTYALFTASKTKFTEAEKDLQGVIKITAGIGGAACLVAAVLQLLGLLASRNDKMPILLKAATAGTHSASIFSLLECDTRQEEVCPGALGWVCVICWCAGCATLCAQPLLLQQELAGRSQNAASIGLLAGVCIMCLLTARIWGGPPLQLGAAAQVVCTSGCALLLILCLGLAVCSGLRLRSITHKVPVERRNYLKDRSKVIQHTLVLLMTQTAAMVAGVTYVQPGERKPLYLILLATAAVVNGVAMVVCYVVCDDECMLAARRALSLVPSREWADSPSGNTSLSLYIKQSREEESRGGASAYEVSPSRRSPMTAYWRAPTVESPPRIPRRRSNPDNRADVVRFVEYTECVALPPTRNGRTKRDVCDLVPCVTAATPLLPPLPPLKPTICPLILPPPDTNCVLCTQSTPDVSTPDEQPIKSCLKKSNQEFSSSTSLPSMESVKDESKSQIEQVNNKWNNAYSKDTEKVLSEISTDLDFLLNRSGDCKVGPSQIEKAPT